jgi:hypothetical protein
VSTWLGEASADELLHGATVGPAVQQLRSLAASLAPGRTGDLIAARVQQMIDGTPAAEVPNTDAEHAVVAMAEQFLLDAHGIDDSMIDGLRRWYTDPEVVAIMFHLALVDGFTKFGRVFAGDSSGGVA